MAGVPRAPGSPGDGRPAGAAGEAGRRVDVLTKNVGEISRKAQARDLAAGVVTALFRVVKLSTLHAIDNQAMVRTIDDTVETVRAFCDRADQNVSVLFAHGSIFIGGQLLKASRAVYESAIELGAVLERCGASELHVARDVKSADFYAFATALAEALRSPTPVRIERPSPRIRLRSVSEDALRRGLQVERLAPDAAIVRAYASAVVIMRRFYEDLMRGRYLLPQRVKRIAQRLVDLSSGETPAFLGVTSVRNANHDDAGRAVNTAVLSLAIARQITTDPVTLVRLAMAALLYDTARPRLLGIAGEERATLVVPQLSDQQQEEVPAGTAVVLTALGRVNEPSVMRTVIAYEAHWLRAQGRLGPVYAGLRQATLQARVVATARAFNDMLTPAPGESAMSADQAIATLEQQGTDVADRTVLRLLVGALGIFPTGTLVELSTAAGGAEVALVVETPADPVVYSQPRVRVVIGPDGGALERPYEIDLANQPADATRRHIRRVVATSDDAGSAHLRSFAATPAPAMSGVRPQQPSLPPTLHLPRGAAPPPPVSRRGEQPMPSARGPVARGAAPQATQARTATARGLPPSPAPPAGGRRPPPPAAPAQGGAPSVPRRGSRTDPWTDSPQPQPQSAAPPSGYGVDRSVSSQPGPTVAVSYGNTQQFPPVPPAHAAVDPATETSPHQSQATRAVSWQQDAEIGDVDIDVDMELGVEAEAEAELELEAEAEAAEAELELEVEDDEHVEGVAAR